LPIKKIRIIKKKKEEGSLEREKVIKIINKSKIKVKSKENSSV